MMPSVGGTQGVAANEGRTVGNKNFRLQARPLQFVSDGVRQYVCHDDGGDIQDGTAECLNPDTGIYEKEYYLYFFDLRDNPLEEQALLIDDMSWRQRIEFHKLCWQLNRVAWKATYFQNGLVCKWDGSNLSKPEDEIAAAN